MIYSCCCKPLHFFLLQRIFWRTKNRIVIHLKRVNQPYFMCIVSLLLCTLPHLVGRLTTPISSSINLHFEWHCKSNCSPTHSPSLHWRSLPPPQPSNTDPVVSVMGVGECAITMDTSKWNMTEWMLLITLKEIKRRGIKLWNVSGI